MKKNLYIVICAVLLSGCASDERVLDLAGLVSTNGESVNTRFEQSMAYNNSRGEISLDMGNDEYVVYVCTDSHITRGTHRNLDYFIDQYRAETAPKIAIHLGDVINAQHNFPCADSILHFAGQTDKDTVFVTPGNHDLYFKQWSVYREYFKSGCYWFETRNGARKLDLFICLDSADGTLGTDQMQWLRELLERKSREGYRRMIVYTHTHLWKLDMSQGFTSNMALEETYELTSLLGQYKIPYVWSGHQHARQSVFFKGVNYLVLNATKDSENGQSYMKVEMGESAIYHYIDFPRL